MENNPLTDAARRIMDAHRKQTPEEWVDCYRELFPNITQQDAETLYPLFLQAIDAPTQAESMKAFKRYREVLSTILKGQRGLQHGR